jgi:hypothetical protein
VDLVTAPPGTAIAVTARFIPLAWIFFLIRPAVAVDAVPVAGSWGRTVLPVGPGPHRVQVYVPYFLPPKVGRAEAIVTVQPGQTVELEYRAPAFLFARGALGTPPQRYPGLSFLIIVLAAAALILICSFGIALLSVSS